MTKLGRGNATNQNMLVDIQPDQSLHVTNAESGAVFRIRELSDQEAAAAVVKPMSASDPSGAKTIQDLPAIVVPEPGAPLEAVPGRSGARKGATPRRSREMPIIELSRPTAPVQGPIGRSAERKQIDDIESVLFSEVFVRVQEVYERKTPEEALYFLLDLALEKIPCDAGSVLEADSTTGDLTFTAARGPKASELLTAKMVIPAGVGVVGFCAHEGVTVALSDVPKDPRFYGDIAQKVDYETKSVLASPMMTDGRTFGCMQLVNRVSSPIYAAHEVGILSYIAHQAAKYLNAYGD
jgi:hypothetical protein